MDTEIWMPVIGFEGIYEISSFGNIKGFPNRYNGQKEPFILAKVINRNYHYVSLCKAPLKKLYRVGRLVGLHFIPNPDNLPEIHHIDYNKLNDRVSNLKWVTRSDNTQDAYDKGYANALKGADNPRARLTNEQVMDIYKSTLTYDVLAKKYDVPFQTIGSIKVGQSWSHLTGAVYQSQYKRMTVEIVRQIFLDKSGSQSFLGKKYNISQSMVSKIKRRIMWTEETEGL